MSELIDRQALKAAHGLGTDCCNCKQSARSCQYDRDFSRMDFCEWLDDAPAIDAVPVVHGHWDECGELLDDDIWVKCSVCGCLRYGNSLAYCEKHIRYCPNCGARMDGGKDEPI